MDTRDSHTDSIGLQTLLHSHVQRIVGESGASTVPQGRNWVFPPEKGIHLDASPGYRMNTIKDGTQYCGGLIPSVVVVMAIAVRVQETHLAPPSYRHETRITDTRFSRPLE